MMFRYVGVFGFMALLLCMGLKPCPLVGLASRKGKHREPHSLAPIVELCELQGELMLSPTTVSKDTRGNHRLRALRCVLAATLDPDNALSLDKDQRWQSAPWGQEPRREPRGANPP